MMRLIGLLLLAGNACAAGAAVDIDTAARIYQAAAVREQVRAALPTMPKQIRDMFSRDVSARLSDEQLAAVSAAAERGFRIDVFETPALGALAQNLDLPSVVKIEAFLASDLGKRMVAADVEAATMGEANIDKVMSGELTVPSTPKRDALFQKLERATKSTESTVHIFLSMGEAVALGTAIGSGLDQKSVSERAQKSGEVNRAGLEEDMRLPMQRFLTYSYRNMSDADLKHLLAFTESSTGGRYVTAYNAAMGAGYDAMGKRTGEELGESLRELAQAQFDHSEAERAPPAESQSPLAAPQSPLAAPQSPLAEPQSPLAAPQSPLAAPAPAPPEAPH
jgi:hypothetical protein